ncbi:MAG: c-type cytochrome biogenesis protein CcsB [Deltaproteobacteria bacterium]|nr:c-type cytochrome biogenesis protein CcsB [Deltaproteobacteria bacterium]
MTSVDLNSYVTFGYLGVFLVALLAQAAGAGASWGRRLVRGTLIFVWVAHTASIGLRWVESYRMGIGHAPLSNLYESLVFFAWAIGLALILAHYRFRAGAILLLGLPMTVLVMAYTFLLDPEIKPLIPALQSNWLVAHVVTCFLGYAGFAVSFVAAILVLLSDSSSSLAKRLPATRILDEIVYKSVLVGLPMLTLGIVTGAAWADYAWGSYWSWDPKETWSLITWMVYSAFLHARLARGWSGAKAAMLSVIGFGAVMFTYFGVNYLPGLHSYF